MCLKVLLSNVRIETIETIPMLTRRFTPPTLDQSATGSGITSNPSNPSHRSRKILFQHPMFPSMNTVKGFREVLVECAILFMITNRICANRIAESDKITFFTAQIIFQRMT